MLSGRTAVDIFPALVFQCFIHDRIYGLVIKLCGIQILRYQPDIEHIAVSCSASRRFPRWIFHSCSNTHPAGLFLCKRLRQFEAVLAAVRRYIIQKPPP